MKRCFKRNTSHPREAKHNNARNENLGRAFEKGCREFEKFQNQNAFVAFT
jgi:hypothetical protein